MTTDELITKDITAIGYYAFRLDTTDIRYATWEDVTALLKLIKTDEIMGKVVEGLYENSSINILNDTHHLLDDNDRGFYKELTNYLRTIVEPLDVYNDYNEKDIKLLTFTMIDCDYTYTTDLAGVIHDLWIDIASDDIENTIDNL